MNRTKRDAVIETHSNNEQTEKDEGHGEHKEEHSHGHGNVHSQIGYSLVLGFVLMLLVDQIGSATVARSEFFFFEGFHIFELFFR